MIFFLVPSFVKHMYVNVMCITNMLYYYLHYVD